MAKVILSAALTKAAKSVGGLTFSTGHFGPFIGRKNAPVNSQSTAQLGIRAGFSAMTKRWATVLTAAQQAGWIAFAAAHQVHDSLGQLITLTGVQMFVKLNGALKAAGAATIDDAPGAVSAGNPGLITVTGQQAGPTTLSIAVTVNPGANDVPIIWSIHPVSIGKKAILKHMVIVKKFPAGTAGPFDILAEWNQQYGLLLTGAVIAAKVQYTDQTTGWQGIASQAAGICT